MYKLELPPSKKVIYSSLHYGRLEAIFRILEFIISYILKIEFLKVQLFLEI